MSWSAVRALIVTVEVGGAVAVTEGVGIGVSPRRLGTSTTFFEPCPTLT